MKWDNNEYWITDDNTVANIDFVHTSLASTYWAKGRSRETVEKSVENSVMLSLFKDDQQIGFARIVTDHSTFAWLCDVFVHPDYREKGLGVWLCKCYLEHPCSHVRINLLATKDAHELYEKLGFERKECMVLIDNGS